MSFSTLTTNMIINEPTEKGITLLHYAVYRGDLSEVKRLLDLGADPNVATKSCSIDNAYFPLGITTLHIASLFGSFEIVRLLLDNGANINARDEISTTPFLLASLYGHISIVEFLAFKGADVHNADKTGWTSMHAAASCGHEQVIEILVAFGADINVQMPNGRSPIISAIQVGRVKCLQTLLKLNADTNIIQSNNEEIRQLLLEHSKKSEQERVEIRFELMNQIQRKVGIRLMKYAQQDITSICLAMSSLDLPPYVLLWIIDWLPNYDKLSHLKKIRLIESCRNSIWKLKE